MMPMMTEEYNDAVPSRRGSGGHGVQSLEVDDNNSDGDWGRIKTAGLSFFPKDKILQGALIGGILVFLIVLIKLVHVTSSAASNSSIPGEEDYMGYNPYRDVDPLWRVRPSNLHLVFLGDSISHYQYLSLVYFLRTGRWFDPEFKRSHLTNVFSYESVFHDDIYGEFFLQTTRLLQPKEICDCVYPKGVIDQYELGGHRVVINRYYHDEELNNTVRFFHAFGHEHDMQGRLVASNITKLEGKEHDDLLNGEHHFRQQDLLWFSPSWAEVIQYHMATLTPKPEYFVLNAGKHDTDFVEDDSIVKELNKSLHDIGAKKAYWRTATYARGGKLMLEENPETDRIMCRVIGNCLNVSWTQHLSELMYWDETHNWEPVYRVMNEDLLDSLGFLPAGYSKFNRTTMLVD